MLDWVKITCQSSYKVPLNSLSAAAEFAAAKPPSIDILKSSPTSVA